MTRVGRGRAPIRANIRYGASRGYRSIQETSANYGYYWLVCGQSSSESGLDPCRGVRGESLTCPLWMVASPGSRPRSFPLGITMYCPCPRGAGEEAAGRAGWGQRGGTYEFCPVRGGGLAPICANFSHGNSSGSCPIRRNVADLTRYLPHDSGGVRQWSSSSENDRDHENLIGNGLPWGRDENSPIAWYLPVSPRMHSTQLVS